MTLVCALTPPFPSQTMPPCLLSFFLPLLLVVTRCGVTDTTDCSVCMDDYTVGVSHTCHACRGSFWAGMVRQTPNNSMLTSTVISQPSKHSVRSDSVRCGSVWFGSVRGLFFLAEQSVRLIDYLFRPSNRFGYVRRIFFRRSNRFWF